MRPKHIHTWFDWVVVERLWSGADPGRNPTWPEIQALLERADRAGEDTPTLAERIRKPERTVWRWRARLRDSQDARAVTGLPAA